MQQHYSALGKYNQCNWVNFLSIEFHLHCPVSWVLLVTILFLSIQRVRASRLRRDASNSHLKQTFFCRFIVSNTNQILHFPIWNGNNLLSNFNGKVFWIFWFSTIGIGCSSALVKSIFFKRSRLSLAIDVDWSLVLIDEWSFVSTFCPLISSTFWCWAIWIDCFVQLKENFMPMKNYRENSFFFLPQTEWNIWFRSISCGQTRWNLRTIFRIVKEKIFVPYWLNQIYLDSDERFSSSNLFEVELNESISLPRMDV